jgi:hypothetical protein
MRYKYFREQLMQLNVNDSHNVNSPSKKDLQIRVAELAVDEFLVLSGQEGHFIQTYHNSNGTYQLELRQGSSEQHFFVDPNEITVEHIERAFQLFMQESSDLNAVLDWQLLTLGSDVVSVDDDVPAPDDALVEYHGVLMSADWPQEIEEAQERLHYTMHGERWNRLPLPVASNQSEPHELCQECGVRVTQFHVPGCGQEECPRCHGKLVECSCEIDVD